MRIVVSGPTGAIGQALIEECIRNKTDVLAICHKGSDRISLIPRSTYVTILELDLDEYDSLISEEMVKYGKYDIFYHLAWNGTFGDARNNVDTQYKNVGYAISAVKLAKLFGCTTFVGAGSQAEYGRVDGKLSAVTPAFPENGYGIAKLCAGQMTRLACNQLGIKHIWTRILSVYGPYDGDKTMVMSTIRQFLNGQIPKFTKGEQQWDYLYSKDAGRAMYLIGEKGIGGKIYPIGSGKTRMLREYIQCIRDSIDTTLHMDIGAIPYAEKQVMYLCADISELKKDTGFEPAISFEEGIRETVEWIRNLN